MLLQILKTEKRNDGMWYYLIHYSVRTTAVDQAALSHAQSFAALCCVFGKRLVYIPYYLCQSATCINPDTAEEEPCHGAGVEQEMGRVG